VSVGCVFWNGVCIGRTVLGGELAFLSVVSRGRGVQEAKQMALAFR